MFLRFVLLFACLGGVTSDAQTRPERPHPPWHIEPTAETLRKVNGLIKDTREVEVSMTLSPQRSLVVRTKVPVLRISIVDPQVVDVVQYSPTEFELFGGRPGLTSMTVWYLPPSDAESPATAAPPVAKDVSPQKATRVRRSGSAARQTRPATPARLRPHIVRTLIRTAQ